MSIRIAIPSDAAAISELVVQLGYSSTVADSDRRIVQLLGRADHAIFVAVESERAVAFIHVCVIETLEHEPSGEIRGLVVDEALRSRGIGSQLVEAAEQWARQRALRRVRVRSNVKRARARAFYERHGYAVTKAQNVLDKNL